MIVERIDILVEEPSMEALLRELLPAWLGEGIEFEIFTHQCKSDLLDKLPSRLKGYSHFLPSTWRVVVLVDRDGDDCHALKTQLEQAAIAGGLRSKSRFKDNYQVVNRIVIEELEAWYFGDWEAVRRAYPKMDKNIPTKAGFRNSDAITGGTWEAFERLAQKFGYFPGGLRKTEAASAIGKEMHPEDNSSTSFLAFRKVIDEIRENKPDPAAVPEDAC